MSHATKELDLGSLRKAKSKRKNVSTGPGPVFQRGSHAEIAAHILCQIESETGERPIFDGWRMYAVSENGVWRERSERELTAQIADLDGVAQVDRGEKGAVPLRVQSSTCSGSIEIMCARSNDPRAFAAPTQGVSFADGTFVEVHAQAGTVSHRKLMPDDRHRAALTVPFIPEAPHSRWLQFVDEIFAGDEDADLKAMATQEAMGVAIANCATLFDLILLLVGSGANGKSVFLETARALFEPESVTAIPPQRFSHRHDRAELEHSLLNLVLEVPAADLLESSDFKAVISGEPVTADRKHRDPRTFVCRASHLAACNELPVSRDTTHGFWRRWLVIEFNRTFTAQDADPSLKETLRGELPGIAQWALQGLERALKRGHILEPPSSRAAKEVWHRKSNNVMAFLEERCATSPPYPNADETPTNELFAEYRKWALDSGHRSFSKNSFGERLDALGFPSRQRQVGGKRSRRRALWVLNEE